MTPDLSPFLRMALAAIATEYPVVYPLRLDGGDAAARPRQWTPVFWGSFDWHSSVHGHWALVRALRLGAAPELAAQSRAALARSLTEAGLAGEWRHLEARISFERPYGLAWVLQLAAELHAWDDPDAQRWRDWLAPLESLAAARLWEFLAQLPFPIRSGQHDQTAFAMGLARDWARVRRRDDRVAALDARARDWHAGDRGAPVDYEPSGHDFLSPTLAVADLMRRVLPPGEFAAWCTGLLPGPMSAGLARWLTPVTSPDRADGKLAHLDGLNLTRAWMLAAVARALPPGHPLCAPLGAAAEAHHAAGLAAARATREYAGTHWLGSFAVYALTRGEAPAPL
jgi:hypothetical protein